MHEHMRQELLAALSCRLSGEDLAEVGRQFDRIGARYTIAPMETHLSVPGREALEKMIKTYLVVKKMEGLSPNTLDQYALYLRKLLLALHKPVEEIGANDIRFFLFRYQEERGISDRSLDRVRSIVSSFFSWAASEEYLPRNPAAAIRAIRYEEKPRCALKQVELELLRRACRTPHESAIIETLYSTGCRVAELVGIRLNDINWADGSVHLYGKGRKHRTSYINAKAEVAIRHYLAVRRHQSEYLIISDRGGGQSSTRSIERTVHDLAERAGLGGCGITPHVMRHTTATQALHSGMPVEDIQKLLGHSSIATTMIYAKTSVDAVAASHRKHII